MHSYVINDQSFPSCGRCDYECLRSGQKCPNQTELQTEIMNSICKSDLVYFVVPNYCGYPCANYFAFNERSVGFFNMDQSLMEKYMAIRKRFIIISNSEENFPEAMQQQVSGQPEILYMKTKNYRKQSISGDLLSSAEARDYLQAFLLLDNSLQ